MWAVRAGADRESGGSLQQSPQRAPREARLTTARPMPIVRTGGTEMAKVAQRDTRSFLVDNIMLPEN
jgi:hypothetical protein